MSKKAIEKAPLAYSIQEFAAATGMGVTKVNDAIRDGRLIPSYWDSKPLIDVDEGRRFIKSLPAEKTT